MNQAVHQLTARVEFRDFMDHGWARAVDQWPKVPRRLFPSRAQWSSLLMCSEQLDNNEAVELQCDSEADFLQAEKAALATRSLYMIQSLAGWKAPREALHAVRTGTGGREPGPERSRELILWLRRDQTHLVNFISRYKRVQLRASSVLWPVTPRFDRGLIIWSGEVVC